MRQITTTTLRSESGELNEDFNSSIREMVKSFPVISEMKMCVHYSVIAVCHTPKQTREWYVYSSFKTYAHTSDYCYALGLIVSEIRVIPNELPGLAAYLSHVLPSVHRTSENDEDYSPINIGAVKIGSEVVVVDGDEVVDSGVITLIGEKARVLLTDSRKESSFSWNQLYRI